MKCTVGRRRVVAPLEWPSCKTAFLPFGGVKKEEGHEEHTEKINISRSRRIREKTTRGRRGGVFFRWHLAGVPFRGSSRVSWSNDLPMYFHSFFSPPHQILRCAGRSYFTRTTSSSVGGAPSFSTTREGRSAHGSRGRGPRDGGGEEMDESMPRTSPTSLPEYVIQRSFDEPTMRFLFEGQWMDLKEEIREALVAVLPPPPRHFSMRKGRGEEVHFYPRREGASGSSSSSSKTSPLGKGSEPMGGGKSTPSSSSLAVDPVSPVATKLLLRALLQRPLGVSYAMYRSSMDRLLAFYETVATAHPVLASVAAHHFTAAGMLSSHGSPLLRQRYAQWLDGADSGHILGTIATQELIAEDGPPVNTEAQYDYHEKCFVLRGTGKFAVVGAMMAEYLIVSAILTTKKTEHNGMHLFVVPLREEGSRGSAGAGGGTSGSIGEKNTSGGSTSSRFSFASLGSRRPDIKIEPIEGEGDVFTASGTAVIYFDHTKISADHLLGPFCMDETTGEVVSREEWEARQKERRREGGGRGGAVEEPRTTTEAKASHEQEEAVHTERPSSASGASTFSFFASLYAMIRSSPVLASLSWEKLNPFPKRENPDEPFGGIEGTPRTKTGTIPRRGPASLGSNWAFGSSTSTTTAAGGGGGGGWSGRRKGGRGAEEETAVEVLRFRTRLATTAISLGMLKKQVRDAVQYTTQQHVIGPSGYREYPYLGLQEVQTPLVSLVVKASLFTLAWNRFQREWLSLSSTSREEAKRSDGGAGSTSSSSSSWWSSSSWKRRLTRSMQLTGLLAMVDRTVLLELEAFRRRFTHVHGVLDSTGAGSWSSGTLLLRQEYHNHQERLREVARSSVVFNIGSTHWGWRVSSVASRFPFLQRFVQNPLYSPRIADLGRHYLFFSHKHFGLKKRLQRALQIETRRGGGTYAWHDWRTFRHADVLHCGEAFMEIYLMETIMEEVQRCSGDLRARKLLRDIGWIYALTRQKEDLGYYVTTGQLSRQKGLILTPHLENLCTVFAPQSRHVAEALCGRWYEENSSSRMEQGRIAGTRGIGKEEAEQVFIYGIDQTPATTRGVQHSRRMAEAAAALCHAPCGTESYWTIIGATTRPERGESLTTTTTMTNRRRGGNEEERVEEEEPEEGTKAAEERVQEDPREWDMLHGLGDTSSTSEGKKGTKRTVSGTR